MSGPLGKAIKNNLITAAFKYKGNEEKIGEVISVNKDTNMYTVNVINRDGINEVIDNVKLQMDNNGIIPNNPNPGDYVRMMEQNKRFVIVSKINLEALTEADLQYYNDYYADLTGGGGGYIGYN